MAIDGNRLVSAGMPYEGAAFLVGSSTIYTRFDPEGRAPASSLGDILSSYRSGLVQTFRLGKYVRPRFTCDEGFRDGTLDSVTVVETRPPSPIKGSAPVDVSGIQAGTWRGFFLYGAVRVMVIFTPWTELDPAGASWEAVGSAGSTCLHFEGFNMKPPNDRPMIQLKKVRFELPSRGMDCWYEAPNGR